MMPTSRKATPTTNRSSGPSSSDNIRVEAAAAAVAAAADDDYEGKKRRFFFGGNKNDMICVLLVLVFVVWAALQTPLGSSLGLPFAASTAAVAKNNNKMDIPDCHFSAWKPDEDLVGNCPSEILKPAFYRQIKAGTGDEESDAQPITDAVACATACCARDTCVTWQFRRDVGCTHGPDVRIGMEKDGPTAYCSAHPPYRWQGQYLVVPRTEREELDQQGVVPEDPSVSRARACSTSTWNPKEQPGQCFGLGDLRTEHDASKSAKHCMQACCADDKCGAWQFHKDVGCFYGKTMFACQPSHDPVVFEPFVGRRKIRPSRTYSEA